MADWHTTTDGDFTVESNSGTPAETPAALGVTDAADTSVSRPDTNGATTESGESSDERPRDPTTGQFVAKPADEPPPEKPAEKPRSGKPRDDPTARVQQAIARQREAERERDALRSELAALRRQAAPAGERPAPAAPPSAPGPSQPAAPTNGEDPEPQLANFESYEAYVKAQARWEARQEFRELTAAREREAQQQHRQREQQDRALRFKAQIDEAQKTDPDVLTRIRPEILNWKPLSQLDTTERPGVENAIAEVILRSDRALSLLQHFSDHPDDVHRFAAVPPEDFLREIGKLEARLEAAITSGTARPAVTNAKPLIKPAGGPPQTGDPNEITDDLSFEEHFRRMNARERQQGRRL